MNITPSKFGCFMAGACIAGAGFFFGASRTPALHAQSAVTAAAPSPASAPGGAATAVVETSGRPFGVSIPNGGSALVKGKDGYAYLVDSRGVYVRAAQSGKGLELP